MLTDNSILPIIKSQVHKIVPGAQVLLYGSRVTGKIHEESDWDILILTKIKHPKATKWVIHDLLFQLSIDFSTFINILLIQEEEWENSAAYYSLRKNIGNNLIAA
jgi:predicted nucleotidyltransferase